jgi:two-component sensor histidine kinase
VGIPENIDIEELKSLGLQLVTSLVDQLNGELELKRDNGTEFIVRFTVTEKKIIHRCQPFNNEFL